MEVFSLEEKQKQLLQQLEDVSYQIRIQNESSTANGLNGHSEQQDDEEVSGPFEGPEKLLEIWWQDSADSVPFGKGLRRVKRNDWENMLDEVHCKVLSVIPGNGVDAYMLRLV